MVSANDFDLGSMMQPVQNTAPPVVSTKNPFAAALSASSAVPAPPKFKMPSLDPLDSLSNPDPSGFLELMVAEPVVKSTATAIKLDTGPAGINLVDLDFGNPTMIPITPEPVTTNQEIDLRFSFEPPSDKMPSMASASVD